MCVLMMTSLSALTLAQELNEASPEELVFCLYNRKQIEWVNYLLKISEEPTGKNDCIGLLNTAIA